MRALFLVLVGWTGCPAVKEDTSDTALGETCAPVSAACPADGVRPYWSLPMSCTGGWSYVDQCVGDDCTEAESGTRLRTDSSGAAWSDPWASCSEDYARIEGELCWSCPEEAPTPEYVLTPAAACDEVVIAAKLPLEVDVVVVLVYGVLRHEGEYMPITRTLDDSAWSQSGEIVTLRCPSDMIDVTYRIGYR